MGHLGLMKAIYVCENAFDISGNSSDFHGRKLLDIRITFRYSNKCKILKGFQFYHDLFCLYNLSSSRGFFQHRKDTLADIKCTPPCPNPKPNGLNMVH